MSTAGALQLREPSTPTGLAPLSAVVPPRLRTIVARTSSSLLIGCVVPAALISVAVAVADVYAAIIAALIWTCAALCWQWAARRRPSGLLILTVVVLLVR